MNNPELSVCIIGHGREGSFRSLTQINEWSVSTGQNMHEPRYSGYVL